MPAVDPLALLLDGRYPDPDTGELVGAAARSVVIEDSLDGAEAELLAALGLGGRAVVVADVDTYAALGARVGRSLGSRFAVQSIVLPRAPHADLETVERIAAAVAESVDVVVAVGSGTINDLCKLVALQLGRPQVVFATAPSMNGYTSLSASMMEDGVKRSLRAETPIGAFFDLRVLAASPPAMIRAGLGDSSCRATAQVDWLLQHLLLDRPYREAPFALLASDEAELLANAGALVAGDLRAMRRLVRTLVLSGFGMTLCNGSYPASQGEHLLGHYIDMMRPPELRESLHGEQIGVCAVAMARLQARFLSRDVPPVLQPTRVTRDDLVAHYGPIRGEICWHELAAKRLDRVQTDEVNHRLSRDWPAIRARLTSISLGAARHVELLTAAGAPSEPAQLGWPAELFASAIAHAREIRNRYTFLDLAADNIR